MKRILTVFAACISLVLVTAQSPQKMSYQAIIRDSNNDLVKNTSIGIQISILQGIDAASATEVYVERQYPTTNPNGLATIEIGGEDATLVSGLFSEIDWSAGNHFIKTETDIKGGSNYTISGMSQLLSVPYALYAKEVENKDDADADPQNEIQDLILNGNDLSISSGNTVTISDNINDADSDPTNELQSLSEALIINNDAGSQQIKNLDTPTDAKDAVTKEYVDLLLSQIYELQVAVGIKIVDYDGNIYSTIKIGDQTWMAENLKVTHYSDGTEIHNVTDNIAWGNLGISDKAWCYYDNSTENGKTYGALYTWAAATKNTPSETVPSGVQGICPDGWHVPSEREWRQLIDHLEGFNKTGGMLKEIGFAHWLTPNTGATNETGFTAIPGGSRRYYDGSFYGIGYQGSWWTSSESGLDYAYHYVLNYSSESVGSGNTRKDIGRSIRCTKD